MFDVMGCWRLYSRLEWQMFRINPPTLQLLSRTRPWIKLFFSFLPPLVYLIHLHLTFRCCRLNS